MWINSISYKQNFGHIIMTYDAAMLYISIVYILHKMEWVEVDGDLHILIRSSSPAKIIETS
jgi:hypothetical protein